MFENVLKNQLWSGQCESEILCLQQEEGLAEGRRWNSALDLCCGQFAFWLPDLSWVLKEFCPIHGTLCSYGQLNLNKTKRIWAILHTDHLMLSLIQFTGVCQLCTLRVPWKHRQILGDLVLKTVKVCGAATRLLEDDKKEGKWSKLHGCIGQSSVMTVQRA